MSVSRRAVVLLPAPLFLLSFAAIALLLSVLEEILMFAGTGSISSETWLTGLIVWWGIVAFVCNAFLERNAQFHLKSWLRFIAADPRGARAKLKRPTGGGLFSIDRREPEWAGVVSGACSK